MDFGLVAYNFEPEYTEEEIREKAASIDNLDTVENKRNKSCERNNCDFDVVIVPCFARLAIFSRLIRIGKLEKNFSSYYLCLVC